MQQSSPPPPLGDKLRYYILREPDNVMVPLVPVDQLPFQLEGIPRQLGHRQMCEDNWKFINETAEPAALFSILPHEKSALSKSAPPLAAPSRSFAPDHVARGTLSNPVMEISKQIMPRASAHCQHVDPQSGATTAAQNVRHLTGNGAQNIPQSSIKRTSSTYAGMVQRAPKTFLPPSGVEPDHTKKEFCSHWIKSGECAFTAVGCKFKHEMPSVEKLRELGFLGVPRWFKKKSAIESREPTWMQRRMNVNKEHGEEGLELPAPRMFDPFKLRSVKEDSAACASNGKGVEHQGDSTAGTEDNQMRSRRPPKPLYTVLPTREAKSLNIDLLIDVKKPSVLSSTSSPDYSVANLGASLSLPPSPIVATLASKSSSQANQSEGSKKERAYVRRLSQITWSSDSDTAKASKQASKRKSYSQKNPNQSPIGRSATASVPARRIGILQSRHAPAEQEFKGPTRKTQTVTSKKVQQKDVCRV